MTAVGPSLPCEELRLRTALLREAIDAHLALLRSAVPHSSAPTPPPADGVWCETVVRSPDAGAEWHLGGGWSTTAALALGWMRGAALRLADALDPRPADGPFPPGCLRLAAPDDGNPGAVFRDWAADAEYQAVQRAALDAGRPVSVNSRGPDVVCGSGEVDVLYSLSARPVRAGAPSRRVVRAL
ncbi:hypothetical protein [Streptomyces bohaiensis]|uniref:Uncharacterized protein n=1 Tax=Streptomyces bohaiensis TaxID=1431344 RepID=A0ABX1C5S4_9ACTN|nr:hypothetical protein [Streptomyces bohaiensis]NJQ14552.1 hypothetical protein [Streptomyces bohaiensis]